MFRFLLFALALASASALQIGQCGASYASTCGNVDVELTVSVTAEQFGSSDELFLVQDLSFDDWGINHVTAIEQMYEANCLSADCSSGAAHPLECTHGVADVWLKTFEVLPNLNTRSRVEEPAPGGQIAVQLFPGDKWVNFNNGEGSFVRFGGSSTKKDAQFVVRVLKYDGWTDGTRSVTLRFHTACAEEAASQGVYAGYLSARAYPAALVGAIDVPQLKSGSVSIPSVQALLKREKAESLDVWAAGVIGRNYLTSATLWKVDASGLKTVIASTELPNNIWNTPSLHATQVSVKSGDWFTWTCTLNTAEAPSTVSSGDMWWDYSCDIALVFTNSRCGGAEFTPTMNAPEDCTDPLFVDAPEPEETEQVHLIYNWHPTGACSDGSQWEGHPYSCTDQYDGGKCAFCVGRANNKESRTCIDRQNMDCNDIFRSKERLTWCNMEFECPASTVSFSLAMILAFVAAFLFN